MGTWIYYLYVDVLENLDELTIHELDSHLSLDDELYIIQIFKYHYGKDISYDSLSTPL